jgi:hypothetical protein
MTESSQHERPVEWEVCQIELFATSPGGGQLYFAADVTGAQGPYTGDESPLFRAGDSAAEREAFDSLQRTLVAYRWEAVTDRGAEWWQLRFRRPMAATEKAGDTYIIDRDEYARTAADEWELIPRGTTLIIEDVTESEVRVATPNGQSYFMDAESDRRSTELLSSTRHSRGKEVWRWRRESGPQTSGSGCMLVAVPLLIALAILLGRGILGH